MQSRNVDLNSVSSNNTSGFSKREGSALHSQNSDDYLDLVLRNEIDQWFKKNSPEGDEIGTIDPTKRSESVV